MRLLRQLYYSIKNHLGHWTEIGTPIALGSVSCPTLVLYGIRKPKIGPFRAWKPHIPDHCSVPLC